MSWARLLKRVFEIDIEHCPSCGGELKIIAAIEYPAATERGKFSPNTGRLTAEQAADTVTVRKKVV